MANIFRLGGSSGAKKNYIFKDGAWIGNQHTVNKGNILPSGELELVPIGTSETDSAWIKITGLNVGDVVCFRISKIYEANKLYSHIEGYASATWLTDSQVSNLSGAWRMQHNNGTTVGPFLGAVGIKNAGDSAFFVVTKNGANTLNVSVDEIWIE